MKFWIMLCISILSFNVYAFERIYEVTGVIDDGGVVQGSAVAPVGDNDVSGLVTDQDGNVHSYIGQWVGDGQISGETDQGDSIELRVK